MGLFGWGRTPAAKAGKGAKAGGQNSTQFAQSTSSPSASGSSTSVRKDLLKLVLRETLSRNGIPTHWITADMLRTSSPRRESGLHVRLLVKHWDPRLMLHGVALEQDFYQRLLLLDATAPEWLMGFSWQFALDSVAQCPPLPHPGSWTQPAPASVPASLQQDPPMTSPADIIEGPVVIPRAQDDVRADLERMLAARDEDLKRNGRGEDGFAPTRPVQL